MKTSCTTFLFPNAGEAEYIFTSSTLLSDSDINFGIYVSLIFFLRTTDINLIKVIQNNKPVYNLHRNKEISYIFSDKRELKLLMRFHLPIEKFETLMADESEKGRLC